MRESIVRFGPNGQLIGVLTQPPLDRPMRDVAILLSNTGTNSRVGPFRLNVELARAFAKLGYATLRFDRSGLGDSARRDAQGDDHAHALLDSTDGFRARHALRVLDVERVKRKFRRQQHRARHAEFFAEPAVDASTIFTRAIPTLDRFREDLAAMAERGARVLLVYTGGMGLHINAPEQVSEMLGDEAWVAAAVSVAWMPDADHLFMQPSRRDALANSVLAWLDRITTR
ncbi:MAG: hypothetical protein MUD17_02955 [Gemmatimonadaceae bacterium]|nr:hypothetical protein [Gemmatimonadaceae bacterium]